jgi:fibronectin type 3 domain-containing protein
VLVKNLISFCRSVCITVAALIIILVLPQAVHADTGSYTYTSGDNGITITGYSGTDSNLAIPATIDGHAVAGIGNNAFLSNTSLVSIIIPASVITIGDTAFSNCPNLVGARFMGNAPSMGSDVFSSCSSSFKVYYETGKTGFSNPWNGCITEVYEVYTEVTGISLNKTSANLIAGSTLNLVPTLNPTNATNKNINWTSSNSSVAAVDNSGNINAVSAGTALITAATEDGGFEATCTVNVIQAAGVPTDPLAVPVNYDRIKISWSEVSGAAGYQVYSSDSVNGTYTSITTIQSKEFYNSGLKTGTTYYYKVRAYKLVDDSTIYSDFTSSISAKTLDTSIGSTLYLYMSVLGNRNSVFARAVALHYGDPSNTCALTVSEALRRIGVDIPTSTCTTGVAADELRARGWTMQLNLNLLQPGDICFTTDVYGNKTGGHSTHTFTFMGWANQEKTMMNICDNQASIYGSVLHTRTIAATDLTDATAYFYHTNISSVSLIPKVPSSVRASAISYNRTKITWSAASGANGYDVYRSTSRYGNYTRVATTGYTNFTDSNLATGTTYYYKVRAYKNVGTAKNYGGYSYISSARPTLSAPYLFRTSALSGRRAKSYWRGVSGASGYDVFRSTSKYGRYTYVASTRSTSYTNSRLSRGRYYYYKIRAYRYVGKSKVYSSYSTIIRVRAH